MRGRGGRRAVRVQPAVRRRGDTFQRRARRAVGRLRLRQRRLREGRRHARPRPHRSGRDRGPRLHPGPRFGHLLARRPRGDRLRRQRVAHHPDLPRPRALQGRGVEAQLRPRRASAGRRLHPDQGDPPLPRRRKAARVHGRPLAADGMRRRTHVLAAARCVRGASVGNASLSLSRTVVLRPSVGGRRSGDQEIRRFGVLESSDRVGSLGRRGARQTTQQPPDLLIS